MIRQNVSPYGAMELKICYQRNMLMGTLLITIVVMAGVAVTFLFSSTSDIIVIQPNVPVDTISITIIPPPTIIPDVPIIGGGAIPISGQVGIPVPIADEALIDDDVTIASRNDLAIINMGSPLGLGNDSGNIVVIIPEQAVYDYPEIDEWRPYQQLPEMIYEAVPDYPRLARQAGMEASVWIKALVDKDGNVIKAVVFKSSGSKAGFDEAAIAAAYNCKFRPAVQNGFPVPAWVTYKVEFILNK
ncbi:MAG: energy transducer TonB [Candidatus Zixiibacteriota bacterium]